MQSTEVLPITIRLGDGSRGLRRLDLSSPHEVRRPQPKHSGEPVKGGVADVRLTSLDRTDIAAVHARGAAQGFLGEVVSRAEDPQCAPAGLMLGGQRRHHGTVTETEGRRLRRIARNLACIDRGDGRNATFPNEFNA